MRSSMTFTSIATLFGAMAVLAAIPSVSVLAVSSRAATFGFMHGVFTTVGIVSGDIIFILIAIGGLSLVAAKLGLLFILIKYVGAGYLIFLGISLCRAKPQDLASPRISQSSWRASFLSGLSIT